MFRCPQVSHSGVRGDVVARGDIPLAILSHKLLATRDEQIKKQLERQLEQELEVYVQYTLHVDSGKD